MRRYTSMESMEKKIKDYRIDDILMSRDILDNLIKNYTNQTENKNKKYKYLEIAISTGITLVIGVISIQPVFSQLDVRMKNFAIFSALTILGYIIFCSIRFFDANSNLKKDQWGSKSLEEMINDSIRGSTRYTAIMRITTNVKGEMQYLVGDDYFLPHGNLNPEETIKNQEYQLKTSLQDDFKINPEDIIKIVPISDEPSFYIKPIHNKLQMNVYVFYDVFIRVQARKNIVKENSYSRKMISLERMSNIPAAMANNKDVIELLKDLPKPKESFMITNGKYRIIWNITSKCSYNCSFCATYDGKREEIDLAKKLDVLHNIATAKNYINNLDIAGGDPLHAEESNKIIKAAIDSLGADKIVVTTTGKGVETLTTNPIFSQKIPRCEITIDASHRQSDPNESNSTFNRNEKDYCNSNINHINSLLEHAKSLTINMPIIDDDLTEEEIAQIVNEVVDIKQSNRNSTIDVNLLRLMPVGRFQDNYTKKQYEEYNPIAVAKSLKRKFDANGITCHYHCSFRVLPEFGGKEHCSMWENKLGIDCAGNVFACAWGGYLNLNEDPKKNPLFLGNLTATSLKDIIEGESRTTVYREIEHQHKNKNERHFCSVVSYYNSGQLYKDHDYLSQNNIK